MTTKATDTSRCGACGYSTQGLGSLICPECGNDLRRVGIVTRDTRRGRRLRHLFTFLVAVFFYSGLIFMIAMSFDFVLQRLIPMPSTYLEMRPFNVSNSSRTFYVTGEGRTWEKLRPRLTVRVEMYPSGHSTPLVWRPAGGQCSEEQAFQWLRDSGVPETDANAPAEAKEIADFAQQVRWPTLILSRGVSSSSWRTISGAFGSASYAPWQRVQLLLLIFWWLIWLAGVAFLWRQRPSRRFPSVV